MVFQPIANLVEGNIFGEEALARCTWPEFRSPLVLFRRAEREQGCGRLGRLIREVTFSHEGEVPLFVNIHPQELQSGWLSKEDDPIATTTRPVYLEITESKAIERSGFCRDLLLEICARTGAKVAVDDLGAGFSNLTRIIDLEPSIVKLDRAIISGIDQSRRKQAVTKHLVRLCDDLGARVVAEGIESIDELHAVMDVGVELGQGYFLARPEFPSPQLNWTK